MDQPVEASSKILTLANVVSVVRLMAIPVFLYLVIHDHLVPAFILLVAAVLTDFVDGMIARRMNQITKLGQFLDPLADRLFIAAAVVALAIQHVVPWWFVGALMARDALLGIGGLVMSRYGNATLPVKWWGKVSTFGLLFVLPLFLLAALMSRYVSLDLGNILVAIAWPLAIAAVVLYWTVGFLYLFDAIRLAKEVTRGRPSSWDKVNPSNKGV